MGRLKKAHPKLIETLNEGTEPGEKDVKAIAGAAADVARSFGEGAK
jgi:hypothetical protein